MRKSATPFPAIVAAVLLALLWLAPRAQAAPLGTAFTYQGQVTSGGTPVNGSLSMTFSIYDTPGGPVALGTLTLPSVVVTNGLFTVTLDYGAAVFDGNSRWLGLKIEADPELVPRQPLITTPYSLYALTAASVVDGAIVDADVNAAAAISGSKLADDSVASAKIANNTIVNADVNAAAAIAGTKITPSFGAQQVVTNGSAGFGTGAPSARLHVVSNGPALATFETTSNAVNSVLTLKDSSPGQAVVGAINFANGTGGIPGQFAYDMATDRMSFRTGAVPRMTLNSTGLDVNAGQITFGSIEGWKDAGLSLIGTVGGSSLAIEGRIRTGSNAAAFAWNQFGNGTPTDPAINDVNDVYTGGALEVGGVLAVDGMMRAPVGIGRNPVTNALEVEGGASKTTAGGWLANSDRRLKTDIEGIEDALDVVRRLHPVRFRYNEAFLRKHPLVKDVYYHNYIAQEFQQVFPDSVQDDGEGFLQIDTYPAGIYAVAAIQELDRLVEEKDARISALEERVAVLEETLATRLARIEKALGR